MKSICEKCKNKRETCNAGTMYTKNPKDGENIGDGDVIECDTFEEQKPDFVVRMEEELNQLDERLTKLNAFIAKENTGISDEEFELLKQQSNAMSNYRYFLKERIKVYKTIFGLGNFVLGEIGYKEKRG